MSLSKPTIMTAVPRFYQNLYSKISLNFQNKRLLRKIDRKYYFAWYKTLNKERLNLRKKLLIFSVKY